MSNRFNTSESLTWIRLIMLCYTEILTLHAATVTLPSYSSIQHMVPEEMAFEEFQDCCYDDHLGYLNRIQILISILPRCPL